MRLFQKILLLALATFALIGVCRAERPVVVCANTILENIVVSIAGEKVETVSLVTPSADLHGFEPSPRDVQKLAKAQALVVNGLGLEPWLEKLIASSGFSGRVIVASARVKPIEGKCLHSEHHGHDHSHELDPHAWQDPRNGILYAEEISAGLAAISPENRDMFVANCKALCDELAAVHTETLVGISEIPPARRTIVTSHDALGYFGHAYGIQIIFLSGLSTFEDVSSKAAAALVEKIRSTGVRAIFCESLHNSKLIEKLAAEAGVSLAGELYTDSLSEANGAAPTYIALLRTNQKRILDALKKQSQPAT